MATYSSILHRISHGQRTLVGYSPGGCKDSGMTEHMYACTHVTVSPLPYTVHLQCLPITSTMISPPDLTPTCLSHICKPLLHISFKFIQHIGGTYNRPSTVLGVFVINKKKTIGNSQARIQSFHCWGPRFKSWSGNRSHNLNITVKNKENNKIFLLLARHTEAINLINE